jgi:hypothetical protein
MDGQSPKDQQDPFQNPDAINLVHKGEIEAYFNVLFGAVDFDPRDEIRFRGIREKFDGSDYTTRIPDPTLPALQDVFAVGAANAARWAEYRFGAYVIPAIMRGGAEAQHVYAKNCIIIDADKGDTDGILNHLEVYVGCPTMVIESGGTTETGQAKRHIYYVLNEPASGSALVDLEKANIEIALKVGGDVSVARLHQPIRYPGTVHQKGEAKRCALVEVDAVYWELEDLVEKAGSLPAMPDIEVSSYKDTNLMSGSHADKTPLESWGKGLGGFAGEDREAQQASLQKAMTQDVSEGGDGDTTRWNNFNRTAGFHIQLARQCKISLNQAAESTYDWMHAHMQPPWDDVRFKKEFKGLLAKDVKVNGEIVDTVQEVQEATKAQTPDDILKWAAHNYSLGEKPERKWIVQGMIAERKSHLFVSEGGAGKSLLCLDLALKISHPMEGDTWLDRPLNRENCGPVVFLTAEDDVEEVTIRLHEIDKHQRRRYAGNKLIIIPLIDDGGVYPLVDTKTQRAHAKWQAFIHQLKLLGESGIAPKVVMMDTMSAMMHGDENASTVINEYFREANRICGEIGATLIVTHHIRKSNDGIRSADEMLQAIRGSNASTSSVRVAIGLWQATDYKRRLKAMMEPERPKMLYKAAVVKANNTEAHRGEITLLRNEYGLLEGVTSRDVYAGGNKFGPVMRGWMRLVIGRAVYDGHALAATVDGANGLWKRRDAFPSAVAGLGKRELDTLLSDMLQAGELIQAKMAKENKDGDIESKGSGQFVDIPGGLLATGRYFVHAAGQWEHPDWEADYYVDPSNGEFYKKNKK